MSTETSRLLRSTHQRILRIAPQSPLALTQFALRHFLIRESQNPEDEAVQAVTGEEWATVRMQCWFEEMKGNAGQYVKDQELNIKMACKKLLSGMIREENKTPVAMQALYSSLVRFCILRTNYGSTTELPHIRETHASLESIFPQSELVAFTQLTKVEKEKQINGISKLVCGIRMFNHAMGKGAAGIEDVASSSTTTIAQALEVIGRLEGITRKQIPLITAQLRKQVSSSLKKSLVFFRQLDLYLTLSRSSVMEQTSSMEQLKTKQAEIMQRLKTACRTKSAVPVDQVYPMFVELSECWRNWREIKNLCIFWKQTSEGLDWYWKSFHWEQAEVEEELTPDMMNNYAHPAPLPDDQIENAALSHAQELATISNEFELLHPGNCKHFWSLPVEYGNMDIMVLAELNGVTVPASWNDGVLKHKDRIYAFSTWDRCLQFVREPEKYMARVLELAQENPDLVQLLHLYSYFPAIEGLTSAADFHLSARAPVLTAEAGTQVDTHFEESYIDRNYHWNEWEMRRRALMLVNLRNKATHSTQSTDSHFRREGVTQVYLPRMKDTQTLRESGTSMPQNRTFIAGLRGSPGQAVRVLDLTLNI